MAPELPEEIGAHFSELESKIYETQNQTSYLTGGYKVLSEASSTTEKRLEAVDSRLNSMDSTLQAVMKSLEKLTSAIHEKAPMHSNLPNSSNQTDQVSSLNLGTNPEVNLLGYRSALTDRDMMLKKVEMLILDGSHPYSWIARAERFFRIGQHSMQMRMDIVSLSLEDDALSWYNYEVEHRPFTDWFEFKKRMLARFAESYEKTPRKRLFGIRQTGTIAEYIREFQELATQVKVEESQLEDIFFNGLQREYQEVIKMKEPVGLPNFITAIAQRC